MDILNLAADKIYPVPFEYCVLENIYDELEDAPEWPWLERAQGKEALIKAQANPIIIHYAGRNPKIWKRKKDKIPAYYWDYIEKSRTERYGIFLFLSISVIYLSDKTKD